MTLDTRLRVPLIALALTGPASTANAEKQFVTAEVAAATKVAVEACIDLLTTGRPLAGLESQGFAPKRKGYKANVDNPLIFAGDSTVFVALDRHGACSVETDPVMFGEVGTIQSLAQTALSGRGATLDLRILYATGQSMTRVVLK